MIYVCSCVCMYVYVPYMYNFNKESKYYVLHVVRSTRVASTVPGTCSTCVPVPGTTSTCSNMCTHFQYFAIK